MLAFVNQACFQALTYRLFMSYGERLAEAILLAKSSRKALGAELGITEQAVGLVIRGKSNAMTAENCARAARFLRVDHFWLATGEGEARPQLTGWPFLGITPTEFYALDASLREEIEDRLEGAVRRLKRSGLGGEYSSSASRQRTGTGGR